MEKCPACDTGMEPVNEKELERLDGSIKLYKCHECGERLSVFRVRGMPDDYEDLFH